MHQSQKVIRLELSGPKLYLPLLLQMPQLPLLSSCRPSLSRGLLQSWVPSEPDPESDAGEEVELLCLLALDSSSLVVLKVLGELLELEALVVLLVLEVLVVLELHSSSS